VGKSLLRRITETGVKENDGYLVRRPIILSNCIALILVCIDVSFLLIIPGNRHLAGLSAILTEILILLTPLMLNRFRLNTLAILFLCAAPTVLLTWSYISGMHEAPVVSAATYHGLKYYLLAFTCIPYLLLDRRNIFVFILGILPGFVCVVFYNEILNLAGLTPKLEGIIETGLSLTAIRTFISYLIISATCFSLRSIIDTSDARNEALINELATKNKLTQEQASDEVNQLNAQLKLNLQQLSEREFILNQSQRVAKVGSWEYRTENRFVFCSDEIYSIFGLDKNFQLQLSNLSEILSADQTDVWNAANEKLLKTGKSYDLTLRIRTPLGHNKWVRVYAFPLEEKQQIAGIRGVCHDITYYKEAEELMRANEMKYRSLFEQASDAIMITDFEGNFIEVNASLCNMFGYSKEELLGRNVSELVDPDDLKDAPLEFQKLRGGEHVFNERKMRHKNGHIIEVEANVKMFSPNRVMAISRDITERKRDQEKLILSQANLNATINNTEILIWSVDRDYRLLTFNKPFANYIRQYYGVEIQLGERILTSVIPTPQLESLAKDWKDHYLRALAGQIVTIEQTHLGIDLHYSLSPIIEGNQIIGVSVFAENVTDIKKHDRELAEANKMIGEMKLLALRSVMSPHFIFNVLNSIQFFIAKNDRLNAINYLSTFSKLIRNVLTHSLHNKVKLSDEIETLKNYIQLELMRFENKFEFIIDIDPDLDLDSVEIPSLLIQPYVENAILHGLYNKKGKGTLKISLQEKNETLLIEIEDNGIGREEAMKLKDRFVPSHKSMGIKLTEERLKLINQNHQTAFEIIDLKDENGPAGTRVKITINL
jgi:PAS domain S-box-containing protein